MLLGGAGVPTAAEPVSTNYLADDIITVVPYWSARLRFSALRDAPEVGGAKPPGRLLT